MQDPRTRIDEARAAVRQAERNAYAAWDLYTTQENAQNPPQGKYAHGIRAANRAHAASHLPEDLRQLLGIDRYGVQRHWS